MNRTCRILLEKRIKEALTDMEIGWETHKDIEYIAQHIGQVFSLKVKANDTARDAVNRLFSHGS